MSPAAHAIMLVTPVWQDSARLALFGHELAHALAKSPLAIDWVIADDGSGPGELTRLTTLHAGFARIYPRVQLHFADHHHGKGAVVREAWNLDPHAHWLAFVDADGSVSAEAMLELITLAIASNSSVLGIRKTTATTRVVESPWRRAAHHGFLLAFRALLRFSCADPQCGAKVIKAADYRPVANHLRENGLAFDSELLATLHHHGKSWTEIPVNWIEKKGSRVRPLHDAWGMVKSLIRVRCRLRLKTRSLPI